MIQEFLYCDEFDRESQVPMPQFAPPGHFYSPMPDVNTIEESYLRQNDTYRPMPGLNANDARQMEMLKSLSVYYQLLPFGDGYRRNKTRYYFNGDAWFSYADAIVLFSMINHFRPKRFIEVGSGYSSAVTLDTCEMFLDNQVKITLIEPYPDALYEATHDTDDVESLLLRTGVQAVDPALFQELNRNDILFIDSSHVVKYASDVLFLLTEVLPLIKPGVVVHFHDIFWPFEYPINWLQEGRGWNEAYFLHAFLIDNPHYEILYFNNYMAKVHPEEVEKAMPLCMKNSGCSLWLRRI